MLHELRAFLPMAEKVKARNPTLTILNYLCIENSSIRLTDLASCLMSKSYRNQRTIAVQNCRVPGPLSATGWTFSRSPGVL